nr:DnaJ domain-containing protein [Myroides phaeus]
MKDYYKIIGVSKTASIDEIKKAYKKLAFKYHPDVSTLSNSHEKFIEISEAYEILSDETKRKNYDNLNKSDFSESPHSEKYTTYQKHKKEAERKAEQYSKTDFKNFKSSVLDTMYKVYDNSKKGAQFGCGLYFGLTFIGASIFGIFKWLEYWVKVSNGEKEIEFWPIVSITWILLFGYLGYKGVTGLFDN